MFEPNGVGGGVHATGAGNHWGGRPGPQLAEHVSQRGRGGIGGDVLNVCAGPLGVANGLAIAEQHPACGAAADVQADQIAGVGH